MIGGFRESLWLFDLDGTLMDTGGAGLVALTRAAELVFGDPGPRLDLAGSTDSGILEGMFRHFGRDANEADRARFFDTYIEHLSRNLKDESFGGALLPGAVSVLEETGAHEGITVGLLTGNISPGARIKTEHYGIDRYFAFGAYGCDHADRNRLGPVALERAKAHSGRSFSGVETLVIGDTPKDVACAKAIGARCLAVTTGSFERDQLLASGADVVVDGLEEVLRA